MASSFRKLFKSKHASTSASYATINSREIMSKVTSFNQEISKDQLPHINSEHIYQIGTFDFKTPYSIKEHEKTYLFKTNLKKLNYYHH